MHSYHTIPQNYVLTLLDNASPTQRSHSAAFRKHIGKKMGEAKRWGGQKDGGSKKMGEAKMGEAKGWGKQKWTERWNQYVDTIPMAHRTPAYIGELGQRDMLHRGLRKAENSLAIQLRTKKAGFTASLHARRVPDVVSPACQCGWRRQDSKHVINFCPNHARNRRRFYKAAGMNRY